MASLDNKVVIITGCSSGIGLATTLLFLSRQARVFGIDISPFKQELDETQKSAFTFHQVDLMKPEAAKETVAACIAKYGPKIDVLANVAGVMDAFGSADTVTDAEWGRVIQINLTVPVQLMQAVLPSMKEHKSGSIVNVSSKAGVSGAAAGVAYTASKHGLVGATKNVAWRFKDEGVRCNAVLPGAVATNISTSMIRENWDQAAYETLAYVHPSRKHYTTIDRFTVRDIARAIAFLASDEAKMINGVMMPVDNGWSVI
ncbi:3-hydroxybutyrate dehydrogenase type 2 [Setomelanomma holmii]|uniref:3-hydroxybutyrate dehydrogenase type 2 n=1 Tax=Setomelanomma holmii TaxID=210430 RepID=A0A9P4GYZ9_9PLEO|nr:3-hydroxybutyrate dehydrogenase type 2 [Setomelanomma holmii]